MREIYIAKPTVRVLYGDTDAAGIVYNANFLRYFEIGRGELMRKQICSYKEIEKLGFVLPVVECWVRYKAPAFYDDIITIETMVTEVDNLKCKFTYRVTRQDEETERSRLLVRGYTIHAATTRKGKLSRLPDTIIEKMKQLTAE
ncbi:MAG: acyl-CoA thioesterase [Deltaproteobacteria bacterium]|nr:acyl-CoA thioesterase [Deltaproteobacteria bacterium]